MTNVEEPPDLAHYHVEIRAEDDRLNSALVAIRRERDSGKLSEIEPCWLRVAELEQHIATLTALRVRYLSD